MSVLLLLFIGAPRHCPCNAPGLQLLFDLSLEVYVQVYVVSSRLPQRPRTQARRAVTLAYAKANNLVYTVSRKIATWSEPKQNRTLYAFRISNIEDFLHEDAVLANIACLLLVVNEKLKI